MFISIPCLFAKVDTEEKDDNINPAPFDMHPEKSIEDMLGSFLGEDFDSMISKTVFINVNHIEDVYIHQGTNDITYIGQASGQYHFTRVSVNEVMAGIAKASLVVMGN